MRLLSSTVGALLAATGAGCTDCPTSTVDDCAEKYVSLQTGVYGLVIDPGDTAEEGCHPVEGVWVGRRVQLTSSTDPLDVRAETASDSRGVYELTASAGDYMLCVDQRCGPIAIGDGRSRVDIRVLFGATFEMRTPLDCR